MAFQVLKQQVVHPIYMHLGRPKSVAKSFIEALCTEVPTDVPSPSGDFSEEAQELSVPLAEEVVAAREVGMVEIDGK